MRDYSKHWDVGVTGVVVRDGKVLYVQRNYEPSKGTWTLPGGFAEHTETLDEAVKRELRVICQGILIQLLSASSPTNCRQGDPPVVGKQLHPLAARCTT